MTEQSHLTPSEREALEQPGLAKRARAINHLVMIASLTGMSETGLSGGIEKIRGMDKHSAKKKARKLARSAKLLDSLIGVNHAAPAMEETPTENDTVEALQAEPETSGSVPAEAEAVVPEQPYVDEVAEEIDTPEAEPEPDIEESTETAEEATEDAISERGLQLTALIFGQDAAETLGLRASDTDAVIESILNVRGGNRERALIAKRLKGMFAGMKDQDIAAENGMNRNAVSMAFSLLRKTVLSNPQYDQEAAFAELSGVVTMRRADGIMEADAEPAVEPVLELESPPEPELELESEPEPEPASEPSPEPLPESAPVSRPKPMPTKSILERTIKRIVTDPVPAAPQTVQPVALPVETVKIPENRGTEKEFQVLYDAVFDRGNVSRGQWLEAGLTFLTRSLPSSGSQEYGTTLWQYLQFDYDEAAFGPIAGDVQEAIDFLKPIYYKYGDKVFKEDSLKDIGLRSLFIKQSRFNGMEAAYRNMKNRNANVTQSSAERLVVLTVAELINERSKS